MNLFADKSDINITNELVIIPIGVSQVCFEVFAIDDAILESEESFTLVVEAMNPNDVVDGNTTVVISDNDGKKATITYINLMMIFWYRCKSKPQ